MKVRDKRHHSATCDEDRAKMLLEELAYSAYMQALFRPGCRTGGCKDIEHYSCKPGAFIDRLPQEKKDTLKRLKSDE